MVQEGQNSVKLYCLLGGGVETCGTRGTLEVGSPNRKIHLSCSNPMMLARQGQLPGHWMCRVMIPSWLDAGLAAS